MMVKNYLSFIMPTGEHMNQKIAQYGVTPVSRPKIKAVKKLDLSGEEGRQIIKSETKLALRSHAKTLRRLADM